MSPPENDAERLSLTLDSLTQVLNERQVNYALIGGLAVALRGTLRATRDIDLLIRILQLDLPGVLEALVQAGFEMDVQEAITVWSRDHLLAFSRGSVRVDWLKPVLPAFEHVLARARWQQVGSRPIRVADAEGLLLLKLLAFRTRDQDDIKGILAANPGRLDLDWLRHEWSQIAVQGDPRTEQFEKLVSEFYRPILS